VPENSVVIVFVVVTIVVVILVAVVIAVVVVLAVPRDNGAILVKSLYPKESTTLLRHQDCWLICPIN
jgi:hypothetical protein